MKPEEKQKVPPSPVDRGKDEGKGLLDLNITQANPPDTSAPARPNETQRERSAQEDDESNESNESARKSAPDVDSDGRKGR